MNKNKRNLYLVMAEATITEGLLAMSIMTPFFHSVGLSNEKISLTQIIFTAVLVLLNVPTGYIADRISRKWANIIGDFAVAYLRLCGWTSDDARDHLGGHPPVHAGRCTARIRLVRVGV